METNAIGDARDELQLVLTAHLGTDDIVECLDDFLQPLLLRIVGLAAAHDAGRVGASVSVVLTQTLVMVGALAQAIVAELQLARILIVLIHKR